MKDRLAVQAHKVRLCGTRRLLRVASVEPSQVVVQLSDLVAFRFAPSRVVQALAQSPRKIRLPVFQQLERPLTGPAERVIDAIDAGAGHNAEDEQFFCLHLERRFGRL